MAPPASYQKEKEKKNLKNLCSTLVESRAFPDAYRFRNSFLKKGVAVSAILHALERCYEAEPENMWGYATKIIQEESSSIGFRRSKAVPEPEPIPEPEPVAEPEPATPSVCICAGEKSPFPHCTEVDGYKTCPHHVGAASEGQCLYSPEAVMEPAEEKPSIDYEAAREHLEQDLRNAGMGADQIALHLEKARIKNERNPK